MQEHLPPQSYKTSVMINKAPQHLNQGKGPSHCIKKSSWLHIDRICTLLSQWLHKRFPPRQRYNSNISFTSHNLQSAMSEPNIVDSLLAEEGFMIGPFNKPPFLITCISPIGIATRKYSGKKRLIIDLSSPHGTYTPSINSIIPAPDFSM